MMKRHKVNISVPIKSVVCVITISSQKGSGYSSGTGQIASEANRPVPDE